MKRKDFMANSMKAGMGRELLVPLFDANSQPEKRLGKIYHHKKLTKFIQESVSMNLNQKTN